MTDRDILQQYVHSHDPGAFAELVRRHGPMVEAAARRTAGADADDVAQAVFILLSRKAASLLHRENVAGWLHEATCLCAKNARRARVRRHRRLINLLQENAMRMPNAPTDEPAWAAVLDEALARLPPAERATVLLRYIEGLSIAETAVQLKATPAAAAKRAARGLHRLRRFFHHRGYSVPLQEEATLLSLQALPFSAQHLATLTTASTANAPAATVVANLTARTMLLARLKTGMAGTLLALGLAGAVALEIIHRFNAPNRSPLPLAVSDPAAPDTTPDIAADTPPASGTAPAPDAFEAAAAQFLTALRDQDTNAVAALLDAPSPEAARVHAQEIVTRVRLQAYAQHPERIMQRTGTFREFDEYSAVVEGGIDTVAPTEQDLAHLTVRFVLEDAGYRVTDTSVKVGHSFLDRGEDGTPLDPHRYRDAAAAWDHWTAAGHAHGLPLSADNLAPGQLRTTLVAYREGLPSLFAALQKTDFPTPLAFLHGLTRRLNELLIVLDKEGAAPVLKQLNGSDGTLPILLQMGDTLHARAAAEDADNHLPAMEPRPTPVEPDVHVKLGRNGNALVPGPLSVPAWLTRTATYTLWQKSGGVFLLQTTDDAGYRYLVSLDSTPAQDDQPAELFATIRQYRPDGTLARLSSRRGDTARDWDIIDSTGTHYVWRVYKQDGMRTPTTFPPKPLHLARIQHFESDSSMRVWNFDDNGRFENENRLDPIGNELPAN